MDSMRLLCMVVFILELFTTIYAFQGIPGLYCGLESCYDVLGAKRESTKEDITRLYRNLAKKWHPDRFIQKDAAEREAATDKFRTIATAYEVLKEEESRRDYDDMMDNPENYYRHYYRYYQRVYGTKVNVRTVIIGFITVLSFIQYWVMHLRYNDAINYFVTVPKYRYRAQEMARQRGLLPITQANFSSEKSGTDNKNGKDGVKKRSKEKPSKEEIRRAEECVIRQIIQENMDIRGGHSKPDIKKILWVQLLMLPYTLYKYICWYVRWVVLFDLKGEPYGRDEKIYLICKNMGVSLEQLETNEDTESLLRQELWIKEKYQLWKQKRDAEMKEKLAESSGYKRHLRYLRKGGPGQITFLDD